MGVHGSSKWTTFSVTISNEDSEKLALNELKNSESVPVKGLTVVL